MPVGSRLKWLIALLVVVVGLDQWSKVYAVAHWDGQPPQSFLGDTFRIDFALNEGAFLSLFGNLTKTLRFLILVVGNAIGLAAIAVYLLRWTPSRWEFFAWSLVFVGGIGNLIDRLRIGAVIDFLNLGVGWLRTGIFNGADMAITAGFFMIVPMLLRGEPAAQGADKPPVPAPEGVPAP